MDKRLIEKVLSNDFLGMQSILEQGFDININKGYELCIAAEQGSLDAVKLLVNNGVNLFELSFLDDMSNVDCALEHAVCSDEIDDFKKMELVEYLIFNGAKLTASSYSWSCLSRSLTLVKYHESYGILPNDNECVIMAARAGCLELIQYFFNNGFELDDDFYEDLLFQLDNINPNLYDYIGTSNEEINEIKSFLNQLLSKGRC